MAFNFGSGFGYPMMTGGMGYGNVNQYFKGKYGCEDCFRKTPYLREFPKPMIPNKISERKFSFWQYFLNKISG